MSDKIGELTGLLSEARNNQVRPIDVYGLFDPDCWLSVRLIFDLYRDRVEPNAEPLATLRRCFPSAKLEGLNTDQCFKQCSHSDFYDVMGLIAFNRLCPYTANTAVVFGNFGAAQLIATTKTFWQLVDVTGTTNLSQFGVFPVASDFIRQAAAEKGVPIKVLVIGNSQRRALVSELNKRKSQQPPTQLQASKITLWA